MALVLLSVMAGAALGLSLFRINNLIRAPFLVEKTTLTDAKKLIGLTTEEQIAQQKRLDTDGDGLSNWDEQNVYHTNANLRDTCGDGIPDNVRVVTRRGLGCLNAPNSSGALDVSGVYSTSSGSDGLPGETSPLQGGLGGLMSSGTANTVAQAQAMLSRDPANIRRLLKEKLPDTDIDSISDEELLKLYDAAVQNVDQQRGLSAGGSTPPSTQSPTATTTAKIQTTTSTSSPIQVDQPGLKPDWKGTPPTSTGAEIYP